MSQIDILLQYADKATALADPALAPYVVKDDSGKQFGFDQSRVFDFDGQGIQVWNTTNDTTSTQVINDQKVAVVTHKFQPGYSLIISYSDTAIAPGKINPTAASLKSWKANANCLLITDRDAASAGNAGFVYYAASAIASSLAQWNLQPTPLGSIYPFGQP